MTVGAADPTDPSGAVGPADPSDSVLGLPARLAYFPVSFFAVVMGLGGLVLATQKIEEMLEIGDIPGIVLLAVTLLVFLTITVVYALKLVLHRSQCAAEFNDPLRLSFFGTFSVSLLLVSIALLPLSSIASLVFWIVGTVAQLAVTLVVLGVWVQHEKFEIKHLNPAWFIPIVGNILVPIAGVTHAPVEISWFFFSVGLVFWLILQTLLFYRLFFHSPLPEKLLPTFFIVLAPPALASIAYFRLNGALDNFGLVLYYLALFLFLFLLVQFRAIRRSRFYLSWWAYSFPVAAFASASVLMYRETELRFFYVLSLLVFALLVVIVCALAVLTVRDMAKGRICVEE
jgi:tellurite resistance protein